MTIYTFDPHQQISQIVLVGCGGSGSQLARSIARIVYDLRRRGQYAPSIRFVDPDRIEAKNCGRQMFVQSQIGHFKAETLSISFNQALGLNISWFNEPFDAQRHISGYGTLVCGAVDNHLARRELARVDGIWLDAGNHYANGQVCLGSSDDMEVVLRSLKEDRCTHLPNAAALFPSLLEPEPLPEPVSLPATCSDRLERGEQALLINDALGIVAGDYVYKLLNHLPITSFVSFVDISAGFSVRSVPITREELTAYQQLL